MASPLLSSGSTQAGAGAHVLAHASEVTGIAPNALIMAFGRTLPLIHVGDAQRQSSWLPERRSVVRPDGANVSHEPPRAPESFVSEKSKTCTDTRACADHAGREPHTGVLASESAARLSICSHDDGMAEETEVFRRLRRRR